MSLKGLNNVIFKVITLVLWRLKCCGKWHFCCCMCMFCSITVYYSPTNAQVIVLKSDIKIYIKIAPTCLSAVTPSSGSELFVLAKVVVVKIVKYGISVCGDVGAYIGSVLVGVCMSHCSGSIAPWRWCDCTETCRSSFNVNFNIVFKTITCAVVGE